MKMELTYATVCSGIECMSVACRGLPLRPVFFSEIEPFPCAILKAHYPDVPNLGDMSKIKVRPIFVEPADPNQSHAEMEITNGTTTIRLHEQLGILAGGTPCQDVSVAGKRAGMQEGSGTRSSLAFDFVRLARELRPRYVLWENVAGSIDSKNAPDFLRFLSALRDCGYSLGWRVLDAQYVRVDGVERAVPQRRRRVWVVGRLGADESIPAQILFENESVAGHTPPRRRTGQGFAYSLGGRDSVHAGVVGGAPGARSGGLQSATGGGCLNPLDPQMKRLFTPDGAFHVLCANNGAGLATDGVCIALDGEPRADQRKGGNGFGINEDGAGYTLTGVDRHGVAYCADGGEVAATITRQIAEQSGQDNRANAIIECTAIAQNTRDEVRVVNGDGQIAGALAAQPGMKQQTYVVSTNSNGVEFFTPILNAECAPTLKHGTGDHVAAVCAKLNAMGFMAEPSANALDRRGNGSLALPQRTGGGKCTAYGFANDARTGFPIMQETAQTQKNGTCPGHESGVVQSVGFKAGQSANGGIGDEPEVSPTLSHAPSAFEPTVCCNGPQAHSTTRGYGIDVAPTMGAAAGNSGNNKPFVAIATILSQMRYIVRRLTPVECERLQGIPKGYTIPVGLCRYIGATGFSPSLVSEFQRVFDAYNAIMYDYAMADYERSHREGEPPPKPPKPKSAKQVAAWLAKISDPATCPDSPRYKGLGNGWAVNQPRWILTRLLAIGEGIDPFTGEDQL